MKSKFLFLGLCLATLTFSYVNAQNAKVAPHKRLKAISKGDVSIPLYTASSESKFPLFGDIPVYKVLEFDKLSCDLTESSGSCTEFTVERGSYRINFTGKFTAIRPQNCSINIAAKVNSLPLEESSNTIDMDGSTSQIFTLTQVVNVDEESKISIVVKSLTPMKPIIISDRLLTITKLS